MDKTPWPPASRTRRPEFFHRTWARGWIGIARLTVSVNPDEFLGHGAFCDTCRRQLYWRRAVESASVMPAGLWSASTRAVVGYCASAFQLSASAISSVSTGIAARAIRQSRIQMGAYDRVEFSEEHTRSKGKACHQPTNSNSSQVRCRAVATTGVHTVPQPTGGHPQRTSRCGSVAEREREEASDAIRVSTGCAETRMYSDLASTAKAERCRRRRAA